MSNSLLKVEKLTKAFPLGGFIRRRYLIAVESVSFEIPEEKPLIVTLAGESGSGKTTIARIILGLLRPTSGDVKYRGKSIFKMTKRERVTYRREVQAIFQDPYEAYNPFYKIDHVLLTPIKKFKLAKSRQEAQKIMIEALEEVGLRPQEVLGKYPHQLSGGERQRIMIARALLTRPKLLVADEPVSMIDMSLRAGILNLLLDIKKKYGMSIIFITHDLSVAYYLSDRIIILYKGRVVEEGDIKSVVETPAHPYTQTLISSVPIPDPKSRWRQRLEVKEAEVSIKTRSCCLFYPRCPYARDVCTKTIPPMVDLGEGHKVACYLYTKS